MNISWICLAGAIVAEVIATSLLKSTDGFTRLWPSLGVVAGYGTAFFLLATTLQTIPVGIAYAVWSGAGIVLVTLIAWLALGQKLDPAGLIGIGLIIAGVLVLKLLSRTAVAG